MSKPKPIPQPVVPDEILQRPNQTPIVEPVVPHPTKSIPILGPFIESVAIEEINSVLAILRRVSFIIR